MAEAPRSNRPTPRTSAAVEAELRRRIRAELEQARAAAEDGQLDDATLAAIIARAIASALQWHVEAPEHTRNATLSSRSWRPAGGPRGAGARPPSDYDRPERDFDRDRPPREYERPRREFDRDRPPRDYDPPRREFDSDRPPRNHDRPQRDFDRPPRDADRPQRDYDRPPRDYDRPPRDFDRGPRTGGKPLRGGGFKRGGGGYKPRRPPRAR